ncbi:chromatin remodeling protein EBS-like [Daucus carota subsp. sativus]|uniref:chromatin remodeling protein EBS-like n=1 Tax=Daucus carota subsp. sativus TaxID=79200 RepID=UPI0007F00000|nr:PREDICTED: chromatin remodeling protein EBS-like isoform X2 [Daucus carota subsp. sativus]XP_017243238.1 PREDICTED: chromatin remodeling protein EBS-like isoform X2 [Daucus carota subsp. sativus]
MESSETDKQIYVARVERFETDSEGKFMVKVRWYYSPEQAGGRRQFHGAKELLLSDQYATQSANKIEGKCNVHSFLNYTKLENVGARDYYCRFWYEAGTKEITPNKVPVYCICETPYNPDDLMLQCDDCKAWFHPGCVKMTIAQAKQLSSYQCDQCSS